jgi:hypothetical protein
MSQDTNLFFNTLLKNLVGKQVNDPQFEVHWEQVDSDYALWKPQATSRSTSDLNSRLELLKIVSRAFPKESLLKNSAIVDLMLSGSGAKNIGHSFKCRLPNGRFEMAKIVNREITDVFGILYTLETTEGFRFTHEFFD